MPRAHPLVLESGRLILPLYSDGFDFSIMAVTDDWGEHWSFSVPIVGAANIQPALARRKDGTIVAYMRDNGPPPKRIMISESADGGMSWTDVSDTELPNPGSGVDVVVLENGLWALVYNDTEDGRHSLAVSLSDDEGRTWRWTRHFGARRSRARCRFLLLSLGCANQRWCTARYLQLCGTEEQASN